MTLHETFTRSWGHNMHLPFLLFVLCVSLVTGRMTFQQEIPNGNSVPHPCGGIWGPVGHLTPNNPSITTVGYFGADFRLHGFTWTVALCNEDSDGDNRTNGEELGDPQCVWTKGASPSGPATGHPGVDDSTYFC